MHVLLILAVVIIAVIIAYAVLTNATGRGPTELFRVTEAMWVPDRWWMRAGFPHGYGGPDRILLGLRPAPYESGWYWRAYGPDESERARGFAETRDEAKAAAEKWAVSRGLKMAAPRRR